MHLCRLGIILKFRYDRNRAFAFTTNHEEPIPLPYYCAM